MINVEILQSHALDRDIGLGLTATQEVLRERERIARVVRPGDDGQQVDGLFCAHRRRILVNVRRK